MQVHYYARQWLVLALFKNQWTQKIIQTLPSAHFAGFFPAFNSQGKPKMFPSKSNPTWRDKLTTLENSCQWVIDLGVKFEPEIRIYPNVFWKWRRNFRKPQHHVRQSNKLQNCIFFVQSLSSLCFKKSCFKNPLETRLT